MAVAQPTVASSIQAQQYPLAGISQNPYVGPAASGAQASTAASQLGGMSTAATQTKSTAAENELGAAASQINAPPVTTPTQAGSGIFSVTPPAPTTITSPAYAGSIADFGGMVPYLNAQANQQNAQQYASLQSEENILGQGSNQALGQLSSLGATAGQQLELQYQGNVGQNAEAMANAGLTGSTVDQTGVAQAQRTLNLGQTALAEQVGSAKASVIQQGTQAMAAYEAAPQYVNDTNTLLSGMAAESNAALTESSLSSQANIANQANTTNLISAGATALAAGGSASAAGGILGLLGGLFGGGGGAVAGSAGAADAALSVIPIALA